MYLNKRESAINKIKLILAQQAPIAGAPTPAAIPGTTQPVAGAPVAPAAPGAPTAPVAPTQYSNIDFNAAITMIPQIMKSLNTTQIPAIRDYMVNNLKADPNVAQQATTSYAVKIYQEERAKRQQQLISEVGKKLGIDPTKIPNMSQNSPLPALPGMAASLKRRIRIANIINSELNKFSDLSNVVESVDRLSTKDKIYNLYKYLSNFDSISDAINNVLDFISKFENNLPGPPASPVTAQMSKKFSSAASLLWVVSFILIMNAAGASDFNAKYFQHITNADKLAEAQSMMLALKSIGLAGLTSAISGFLYKREQKENKPKGRSLYEPFNE